MSQNGDAVEHIEVDQPEQEQEAPTTSGSPSDFLKTVVGEHVVVRLNSGVDYRGVLSCLDGYMNIALEQTEEYVNGVLTNSYGDAFVRGNNGAFSFIASRRTGDFGAKDGQRNSGLEAQVARLKEEGEIKVLEG